MKTSFKLGFVALLIGSLTAVGVASAAPPSDGGQRGDGGAAMKAFDANRDGKLDPKERAAMKAAHKANRGARKAQRIATFDTNKDGKLDGGERQVMQTARVTDRFQKLDTDRSGQLSLDEFKAGAAKGRMGHGGHMRHGKGHHGGPGRGDHARGPGHDRDSIDDDGGI